MDRLEVTPSTSNRSGKMPQLKSTFDRLNGEARLGVRCYFLNFNNENKVSQENNSQH